MYNTLTGQSETPDNEMGTENERESQGAFKLGRYECH